MESSHQFLLFCVAYVYGYVLLRIYKDIQPLTFYFSAEATYFSIFLCIFWANFCFQVQIMFFSFYNNDNKVLAIQNKKSYEQKSKNTHTWLKLTVMWQLVRKGAYFNINCQGLMG